MSCYEWERGDFRLPSREFPAFRRDFLKWYNERQAKLLAKALEIYAKVLPLAKGKKEDELEKLIDGHLTTTSRFPSFFLSGTSSKVDIDGAGAIRESLLTSRWKTEDGKSVAVARKLRKPKADQFQKVKLSCTGLNLCEATITFSPKSCTVFWDVPENNHACDAAHEDPVAVELFRRLDKVNWVRGTGGQIIGNDEHRTEDRSEGGGANYVKRTYGPKGDKPQRIPSVRRRY